MKKLFNVKSMVALFSLLFYSTTITFSQQKYSYIVRLDSTLNLSAFKQQTGFYDLVKLKSFSDSNSTVKSMRINHFIRFLEEINAISVRKFIRKLPENIKTLRSRRGTDFSVEQLQRQFVIQIGSPLIEKEKENLLKKYQSIKNIERNIPISVDSWPPNDQYYIYQSQLYSSTYNIDLPRAWSFTAGNSGIKVGIVDHGIDYVHPDLGNG